MLNNNQNFEKSFVTITKLSLLESSKLVKWFNQQNVEVQIEIFKEQKNQFFQFVKVVENKEIVPVIAFYLAIKHYRDIEMLGAKKNKSMSLKDLEKATELSIKQLKRIRLKAKREKLLNLWSVLRRLKDEGYSLRDISKYFHDKHRFNVSHSYIAEVCKEIENAN